MTADEIARILDELGSRLSPMAERAFSLTIHRIWVEGIISIVIASVLLLILLGSATKIARWAARDYTTKMAAWHEAKTSAYYRPDRADYMFGTLVFGGLATSGGLFLLLVLQHGLLSLLTPEYAAMERILKLVVP